MTESNWDDVGRRFADLGRQLQSTWESTHTGDPSVPLDDAGRMVKDAFDDVAATVQAATTSQEIRDSARQATTSVAEALAATLHQVADAINAAASRRRPDDARHDATTATTDDPPTPNDAADA